jgi:hypothetical protein
LRQFEAHIPTLYPLVIDMLARDAAAEVRLAVREYLYRVGIVRGFVSPGSGVKGLGFGTIASVDQSGNGQNGVKK